MNQQKAKEQKKDKLTQLIESDFLAKYINLSIQGLIAFAVAIIFGGIVRLIWKDIPIWLLFPLTFVFMILFSVMFSRKLNKIQVGAKIQTKYINLLNRMTNAKT
jgi:uncharacterized protein (DUF983 family)